MKVIYLENKNKNIFKSILDFNCIKKYLKEHFVNESTKLKSLLLN